MIVNKALILKIVVDDNNKLKAKMDVKNFTLEEVIAVLERHKHYLIHQGLPVSEKNI